MSQYIEEYLVALGFDLDSAQGKEYLSMCNELENRQNSLVKAGESATAQAKKQGDVQKGRIADDKDEIHLMGQMEEASRRLKQLDGLTSTTVVKTVSQEEVAPAAKESPQTPVAVPKSPPPNLPTSAETPAGQAAAPPPVVKNPENRKQQDYQKQREKNDKKEISLMGDLEGTLKQIGVALLQLERGNLLGAAMQGSKGVQQFVKLLNRAGASAENNRSRDDVVQKTVSGILKKKASGIAPVSAPEDTADAGAEDAAAGGASMAGLAVGAVVVAAAFAKIAGSIYSMGEDLAQTNIQIETMSKQLWISQNDAYQLNGTLSAMGKTTADLNEIAINPTLRQQFNDLQAFERSQLQLPKDFDATAQAWSKDVDTPLAEIKALWGYLEKIAGYKVEQGLGEKLGGFLEGVKGWMQAEGIATGFITSDQLKQQTAPPTSNTSYSNYTEGAKIEFSPHIEVKAADPSSAQSIGDAALQGTQQAFNEAALIKSVQGLNR
jgi:hypothetical protein